VEAAADGSGLELLKGGSSSSSKQQQQQQRRAAPKPLENGQRTALQWQRQVPAHERDPAVAHQQ